MTNNLLFVLELIRYAIICVVGLYLVIFIICDTKPKGAMDIGWFIDDWTLSSKFFKLYQPLEEVSIHFQLSSVNTLWKSLWVSKLIGYAWK